MKKIKIKNTYNLNLVGKPIQDIDSLDEVGYPDYFEYDYRESKVVSSWWNFRMSRKSDGKKVTVFVHFSDTFDNDGKITDRISYWNKSLLD